MSAAIDLTPIYKAKLVHHFPTPPWYHGPPQVEDVETPIFNLNAIKTAFWRSWKPGQIFEAERVVDIKHALPEEVLQRVSDNDWLDEHVPEHAWYWHSSIENMPQELRVPKLLHLNSVLRQCCQG
jgi:hypothetical protein